LRNTELAILKELRHAIERSSLSFPRKAASPFWEFFKINDQLAA